MILGKLSNMDSSTLGKIKCYLFPSLRYLLLALPVLFSSASRRVPAPFNPPSLCLSLGLTVGRMRVTMNESTAKQLLTERFDHLLTSLRTHDARKHGKCIQYVHVVL